MSVLTKGLLSRTVKSDLSNNRFWIEGVLTDAGVIDRENEVVDESAFPEVISDIEQRTKDNRPLPIVIEHRRHDWPLPVGAVTKAWQNGTKLMFRGFISNSPIGQCIQDLVKEGILYGDSIGGDPLRKYVKVHPDRPQPVAHIGRMKLDELSLTGLPVHEGAIFKMAKSLKTTNGKIEKALKKLDTAIDLMKAVSTVEKFAGRNEAVPAEQPIENQAPDPAPTESQPSGPMNPQELEKLRQALEDIAVLMGVELGPESTESGGGEPDVPPPPEYSQEKDVNLENDSKFNMMDQNNQSVKPNLQKQATEEMPGNPEQPVVPQESETPSGQYMEERYCASCDLTLDAGRAEYDVNFCPKCGGEFTDRYAAGMNKKTCDRCRYSCDYDEEAETEGRTNFCPRCGQKYKSAEEGADIMRKSKKDEDAKKDADLDLEEEAKDQNLEEDAKDDDQNLEEDAKDENEDDENREEDSAEEDRNEGGMMPPAKMAPAAAPAAAPAGPMAGHEEEEMPEGGEKEVAPWAMANLDESGAPMYQCMDCRGRYSIDDDSIYEQNCNFCADAEVRLSKSVDAVKTAIKTMKSLGFNKSEIAKALGSIAVASQPKGAQTKREPEETYDSKKGQKAGPQGDDIAVASQPQGAKTQYTTKSKLKGKLLKNLGIEYPESEKQDSGESQAKYDSKFVEKPAGSKAAGSEEGVDPDKWVGTKVGDNDVKGEHSSMKPFPGEFYQAASEHKLTVPLNYGSDSKMSKSLASLASKIEKSIAPLTALTEKVDRMEKVLNSYSTKKSKIASSGSMEKSVNADEVREAVDREFASRLLGRIK